MAVFAVSITKGVSFRGVQQEFSNVYHLSGALPDAAQAALVASNIKGKEVNYHSLDVTFLRYKVWSAGGSAGQNQMIAQGNLSGVGGQAGNTALDRERAVLIRFSNGLDVRGRPKYLRKWFHSCGSCQGVTLNATGVFQNTAQIPSADRTTIANAATADFIGFTVNSILYTLCAPDGTVGTAPVECHRYLEHHQLGDMWR